MNPAEFANIARAERDLWWYRGMRAILRRMLEPFLENRPLRRVLDAGCGTGYLSYIFQRERQCPVIPLDISGEGLRYVRKMGLDQPVQGSVLEMPFANGTFDLVFSMDVLPHLPRGDEHRAAREMARVLVPRGLVVIRAPALDVLRSRHSEYIHERQRYTRRRLIDTVEAEGVSVLRCTYVNSLLLPVSLLKFRIWEPLRRRPPASGIVPLPHWLDTLLYTALALEASWVGTGLGFPAGQSLMLIGEKTG
jgi:SAM-dependent methyltransferase